MVKLIKNICIMLLAVMLSLGILGLLDYTIVSRYYNDNYDAALIDKVDRLKRIKEPKIILVGDSNLAFGINSQRIEEELGMPVVNLGLHNVLGNAFHEQIIKGNIEGGGIVVVCHTSFSDLDEIIDPTYAWLALNYNKENYYLIRNKDWFKMLMAYPGYLRSSYSMYMLGFIHTYDKGCYSRNAFNEYGDVVYKPKSGQMDVDAYFARTPVTVPEINDICVNRLNRLSEYVNSQGADLVVAGYPIAYGKYSEFTVNDFCEFERKLADRLDCSIISDYTDYFYPYDYFYNTSYHLTNKGAEVRTEQLISDLKGWLNCR